MTQQELCFEKPKRTAKQAIREALAAADGPRAVHELHVFGYSENNLATRLSEMARVGEVVGRVRMGSHVKEWALPSRFW